MEASYKDGYWIGKEVKLMKCIVVIQISQQIGNQVNGQLLGQKFVGVLMLAKYQEVQEVNFIPRVSAPSPEQLMMISDV